MPRQEQEAEDLKALLRALVKLKAAARRGRERDSRAAAAALEDAMAAAEKRRSIARNTQARECGGCKQLGLLCRAASEQVMFLLPCFMFFWVVFLLPRNRIVLHQLSSHSSCQQRRYPRWILSPIMQGKSKGNAVASHMTLFGCYSAPFFV
jgi:hypothetical protein